MMMFGVRPPAPESPKGKPKIEDRDLTEIERVFVWRLETLMDAGYPLKYAEQLALRPEVSLREAEKLMHEGCPASTAARILL